MEEQEAAMLFKSEDSAEQLRVIRQPSMQQNNEVISQKSLGSHQEGAALSQKSMGLLKS